MKKKIKNVSSNVVSRDCIDYKRYVSSANLLTRTYRDLLFMDTFHSRLKNVQFIHNIFMISDFMPK